MTFQLINTNKNLSENDGLSGFRISNQYRNVNQINDGLEGFRITNNYKGGVHIRHFLQRAKIVGSGISGVVGSAQGTSVSLSGDGNTLAVGGINDGDLVGATWIFVKSGTFWIQQDKLVGTGYIGQSRQGRSVSLSSDGNTLAVGGNGDGGDVGATWIFVRFEGAWSQQGTKLVGTGYVLTNPNQGNSVSLSGDGNTLAVGGPTDNSSVGATWIFTRSGNVWSQQGTKLVGTGYVLTNPNQGNSVSLSGDGNTLAVGGPTDNGGDVGATWIFTRFGNVWSQQGNKLFGTGAVGSSAQGTSVSLSGDGNTLAVGGYLDDDNYIGATWIFTRFGNMWSQQGNKLVGTGYIGQSRQGNSVSLSGDGNTLAVGGHPDDNYIGATWIFARSGNGWSQKDYKLVGTGYIGQSRQGTSVSLSKDGNTLAVGGNGDNPSAGATWIFENV